jgi:hypothetical protein
MFTLLAPFFFRQVRAIVLAENGGGADSKGEAVAEIEAVQSLFVLSCVLVSSGLLCCWASRSKGEGHSLLHLSSLISVPGANSSLGGEDGKPVAE